MPDLEDQILRAIGNDGAFRVIAARASQTTREACRLQGLRGASARRLSELLTGAALFRETLAPSYRLQCILDSKAGNARLVADAHPDGGCRGLAVLPEAQGALALGEGSLLRVARELPSGKLHEGVVEVNGPDATSEALMTYLQESEQIVAVLAVATTLDPDGALERAGGYLVQLLPEANREALAAMTARLAALAERNGWLGADFAPEALVAAIFADAAYTELERGPLRFRCRCSAERVRAAIASLARDEIQSAIADGEPLTIRCDYCTESYSIDLAELAQLAARAGGHDA